MIISLPTGNEMAIKSKKHSQEIIVIPGDPVTWEEIETRLITARLMRYELERSRLRTGAHLIASKGKDWCALRIRELDYKINALRHGRERH